jgi:hypothetical protein
MVLFILVIILNYSLNNYLDGDTEPEILFVHANDHRRWRITQTIERLCFNLCFGFNLYELLVEFY